MPFLPPNQQRQSTEGINYETKAEHKPAFGCILLWATKYQVTSPTKFDLITATAASIK